MSRTSLLSSLVSGRKIRVVVSRPESESQGESDERLKELQLGWGEKVDSMYDIEPMIKICIYYLSDETRNPLPGKPPCVLRSHSCVLRGWGEASFALDGPSESGSGADE